MKKLKNSEETQTRV